MSGCRSKVGSKAVPNSRTHDRETPVAKSSVCSWNSEDVGVSGAKLRACRVRNQQRSVKVWKTTKADHQLSVIHVIFSNHSACYTKSTE